MIESSDQRAPYYANAWSPAPGYRRYVPKPATTQPMRCPRPPYWTGRVRDGDGRWHEVKRVTGTATVWSRYGRSESAVGEGGRRPARSAPPVQAGGPTC
jgi:hypothetical protein